MKKHLLLILVTAMMAVTSAFAQTRELQIYKSGSLIQSFPITNIDSVKVGYAFSAPGSVTAQLTTKSIVVSWTPVPSATSYQLYRSVDNKNFVLLANNLTTTSYTDNSPLSGTNYYKVKALGDGAESAMSTSTGTATLPSSGLESGLYLGVMGFNQSVSTQPISILKGDTKSAYDSFIDALSMKNGTVLCYSVDQAINALQTATLPDDVSNVGIVTFTDGLDQGSLMIDDRFDSDDEFLTAIQQRITKETVAGLPISAYSIGLRGNDVTSAADIAKFQSTLKQLASSEENATEVQNMAEVNAKFLEIAERLNRSTYIQTITLKMPGISNGTRIRFTFDNVSAAELSSTYIEGTFNLRSRTLTDVVYHGMTSTSGTTITGVADGIFVTFTFDGIHTEDNNLLSKDFIDEWYLTSASSWQINSEFDKDEQPDILSEQSSAVVMLVLDCSSSLGSQFPTAQANAKSFISTLCSSTDGGNENPHNDDPTLYSTTPADLTLAISYNGVRYFLTQEQYAKANLSRATIEGLTIIFGGQQFIMALEHEPTDNVYVDYAIDTYGEQLPNLDQAEVISARWTSINAALVAFGGTQLSSSWTCTQSGSSYYYYLTNGNGRVNSYSSSSTAPVRLVRPLTESTPIIWRSPLNLTLAVKTVKNTTEYYTQEEWRDVPDKDSYSVIGLAIVVENTKFILALNNENINNLYASNAISYYGESLPTYQQARVISACWSYINSALVAFGGTQLSSSWTCTQSGSSSYYYHLTNGNGRVNPYSSSSTAPVRLVYPFEEPSAE